MDNFGNKIKEEGGGGGERDPNYESIIYNVDDILN